MDAEGVMVVVRWLGVAFAVLQTATYYRPFPPGIEAWAWGVNAAFALAALALTAWWLAVRTGRLRGTRRMLGLTSLVTDAAFASAVTWIYAFDPETAIFAILYIVALEGAFRYGWVGALGTIAALGLLYGARELWAGARFGTDVLPASVSFRIGVGFFIAAVAGAMAERFKREHRRLEVALRRERDAAAALRSLDELRSTFLAAVSHELRTPLTSILGFSLTMQDRSNELLPETRMMLEQVVEESQHLGQLLEDLLDIERMGRGAVALDCRDIDALPLAAALVDRIARRTGREVVVDVPPDVSAIVDARKLERVVENLLSNAAKYSPEGSPVLLRMSRYGKGLLVVVDDEGPGVPESLRRSIFAPFERGHLTSAHQPGTGIGLSLVDRFAKLHGGMAWVEGRDDGVAGASFRVYLPDGEVGMRFATVEDEPWGGQRRAGGGSAA